MALSGLSRRRPLVAWDAACQQFAFMVSVWLSNKNPDVGDVGHRVVRLVNMSMEALYRIIGFLFGNAGKRVGELLLTSAKICSGRLPTRSTQPTGAGMGFIS